MPHPERPTRIHPPTATGLYDPAFEHDACGVAFVARLNGVPTHETVERALRAVANLEHRGAQGADPDTGDGAGILVQIPDAFFRGELGERLPPPGAYAVGTCFLPDDAERRARVEQLVEDAIASEGQELLGWRDVPVDLRFAGTTAAALVPCMRQVVVGASAELAADQDAFERKLYVIRRIAERAAGDELVVPSLSSRTLVYKGMLTAPQLAGFFPDLADPRFESALALIHSRFSTNTFPSWALAHPYRMIAHNGEINTLRGNVNWMRARESQLASELFGDDLPKVLPVIARGRLGHGDVRQRARAARPRGPLAPARDDDDDPRGVRGTRRSPGRAEGLLRVPPVPDGGVGRAGRDRVHRRPRDRRDARPQRPPPRPLVRDRGRLGRARLRDRRARGVGGQRRPQGPAAAGQALPRRSRAAPRRPRRRDQAAGRDTAAVRGVGRERDRPPRRPAGAAGARAADGAAAPPPAPVRLRAGGHEDDARRRSRATRRRRSARWATTRRSRCCRSGSRSSTRTSSSCSRR